MEGKGEPGDSFTLSLPLPLLLVVANYSSSVSPTPPKHYPQAPLPHNSFPTCYKGEVGGGEEVMQD